MRRAACVPLAHETAVDIDWQLTTWHANSARAKGLKVLSVRGVSHLRIADASVIPTTPVAALNAPSMLIGYRAARFIREDSADF